MLVLNDDETVVVGKAFDRAWDSFLKKGLLTPHNFHASRSRLAERILRSAFHGERDEWRLARDAVAHEQAAGPREPPVQPRRRRKGLQRPRPWADGKGVPAAALVAQIGRWQHTFGPAWNLISLFRTYDRPPRLATLRIAAAWH